MKCLPSPDTELGSGISPMQKSRLVEQFGTEFRVRRNHYLVPEGAGLQNPEAAAFQMYLLAEACQFERSVQGGSSSRAGTLNRPEASSSRRRAKRDLRSRGYRHATTIPFASR